MAYEDSNKDGVIEYDYLANEEQFSKDKFESMCKESFDNCHNEQSNYFVKTYLKSKYGFKELPIEAEFIFEEACD
jgi:hypothetical protein